jgi:hypothetical protein
MKTPAFTPMPSATIQKMKRIGQAIFRNRRRGLVKTYFRFDILFTAPLVQLGDILKIASTIVYYIAIDG